MCKKLIGAIVILIVLLAFSIPAMAYPERDDPAFQNTVNSVTTGGFSSESDGVEEAKEETSEDLFEKLLVEIIRNPNIKETEQFLAKVDIVNNNTVDIIGQLSDVAEEEMEKSEYVDICGVLAVYNAEKDIYEEYAGTSGESRWVVGDSGTFSDSFQFEKGYEYRLKIIIFIKPLMKISVEDLIKNLNYLKSLSNVEESSDITMEDMEMKTTPEIDNAEILLELNKNLQINYFTINMLDKEKLVKSESNFNLESILKKLFKTK
ncbi:MAG TPA: hypothetical protein GXX37_02275 [Clostridiaceae bacterium]|nr:hypothetical protein [Clostridiaceae bacterium]